MHGFRGSFQSVRDKFIKLAQISQNCAQVRKTSQSGRCRHFLTAIYATKSKRNGYSIRLRQRMDTFFKNEYICVSGISQLFCTLRREAIRAPTALRGPQGGCHGVGGRCGGAGTLAAPGSSALRASDRARRPGRRGPLGVQPGLRWCRSCSSCP